MRRWEEVMDVVQGVRVWDVEHHRQREVRRQIEKIEQGARDPFDWHVGLDRIGGTVMWRYGDMSSAQSGYFTAMKLEIPPVEACVWFESPRDVLLRSRGVTRKWRKRKAPDEFLGATDIEEQAEVVSWIHSIMHVRSLGVDTRITTDSLLSAMPRLSTIDLLCMRLAYDSGVLMEDLDDTTLWRWRWHKSSDSQRIAQEILGQDKFRADQLSAHVFDSRLTRVTRALAHLFLELDEEREGTDWRDFLAGGWPHLRVT